MFPTHCWRNVFPTLLILLFSKVYYDRGSKSFLKLCDRPYISHHFIKPTGKCTGSSNEWQTYLYLIAVQSWYTRPRTGRFTTHTMPPVFHTLPSDQLTFDTLFSNLVIHNCPLRWVINNSMHAHEYLLCIIQDAKFWPDLDTISTSICSSFLNGIRQRPDYLSEKSRNSRIREAQ